MPAYEENRIFEVKSVVRFYRDSLLSGLLVLKGTYKRDHIVNVTRLIRRVALLEVKKNYQLVSTFSR